MGKGRNPQGACATSYERVHIHEFIFMSAYSHILTRVHHKLAAANCMYLTYTCVKNADMKNNQ